MIDDGQLRSQLRAGKRVTLVLGAGVSHSRGLPLWQDLLRETWKLVLDEDPYGSELELLERARQACNRDGIPQSFVERLDLRRHPLEIQFAFERIYAGLHWQDVPDLRRKLGLKPQRRSGNRR